MLNTKKTESDESSKSAIPIFDTFSLSKIAEGLNPVNAAFRIFNSNVNVLSESFQGTLVKSIETMETAVTNLAMKFGGNREMVGEIEKSLSLARSSVISLGGTLDDVVNIQAGVIKGLQTQTILDKESYGDLYAIGNLINDGTKTTAESTASLVKQFSDAGYGLYNISKEMGTIISNAREIGVATSAVYKQLTDNIGVVSLYNFENGVQGMAKMATEAAGLRLNMADVLKVADKVFNPEDAIQMAADMQRLGVNVTSLLDPYKLMDMGRNHPEELQKSMEEMLGSLTYFDEKQQAIRILPNEQGRLRKIAEAMGMGAKEAAQMAVNFADMDRKMSKIKFSSDFATEEDKQLVAHMAQIGEKGTQFEGKYVVNLLDESGEPTLKAVEELTKADKERLKKMEGDKGKSPTELQIEANNYLSNINNSLKAREGVVPTAMAASTSFQKIQKGIYERVDPVIKGVGAAYGMVENKKGYINVKPAVSKAEEVAKNTLGGFLNALENGETDMTTIFGKLKGSFNGLVTDFGNASKNIAEFSNRISEEGVKSGKYSETHKYDDLVNSITNMVTTVTNKFGVILSNSNTTPNTTIVTNSNYTPTTNPNYPITPSSSQPAPPPSSTITIPPASNTLPVTNANYQIPSQPTTNTPPLIQQITTPQTNNNVGVTSANYPSLPQQPSIIPPTLTIPAIQPTSIPSTSIDWVSIISTGSALGFGTALSKFENPGTIKMTLYGDKVGLGLQISNSVGKMESTIGNAITESQKSNTNVTTKVEIKKEEKPADKNNISVPTPTPLPSKIEVKTPENNTITNNTINVTPPPKTPESVPPIIKFTTPKPGGEDETSLISDIKKEETKKNEVKDLRTPMALPEEPKKETGVFSLLQTTEKPYDVKSPLRPKEEEKEKGIVPNMKSEDRLKMMLPYLEKFGALDRIIDLVGKEKEKTSPVINILKQTEKPYDVKSPLRPKEEKTSVVTVTPQTAPEPIIKFTIPKIEKEDETSLISEIIRNENNIINEVKDWRAPMVLPEEPKKEKTITPTETKTIETRPTTDIFGGSNKLTDSIVNFLNKNKPITTDIKESPISPVVDLSKISDNLKTLLTEKTITPVSPPPVPEPTIKFTMPKIGGEDETSLISELIRNEENIRNEVKDLRAPMSLPEEPKKEKTEPIFNILKQTEKPYDIKVPLRPKEQSIEKEIKTVDTEQSKILKFENDFLGNFNKMNETLDKGFNAQVSSADLNNKNIEKDGEIKTQILSANVKLSDDFTKGISNITNIDNNQVNQTPTTELKMTDEIKNLLGKNQSQTFVEKLTTVPPILNPTIKLPDYLNNVKPEGETSIKVKEDIISTTKKTTELFNDINKIYNPSSLIANLNESNKGLYSTINKVITPVNEGSVTNVKPPVTTTPISNVIPPAITNVSNVVRTETVTKDINHKFDDIKGDITINVPNMPNLEAALNNPQFIGDLQRKIVNHVINQKILEGAGNYSYNV